MESRFCPTDTHSALSHLRTGNPIIDVLLSGLVLSLITYIFSNWQQYLDNVTYWLKERFRGNITGELRFKGEEYIDRWGDSIRNYPETFRAVLHLIDTTHSKEVNTFQEIQTVARNRYESDDKEKQGPPVTFAPAVSYAFSVGPQIFCKIELEVRESEDSKAPRMRTMTTNMKIFSHTLDVTQLKKFLEEALEKYRIHMKEEIDKNQYYFITKIEKIDDNPTLLYDQFTFHTNRSFNNIFFPQKEELLRRLDFFLNNKAWYQKRGVPYTLGFMFYGPPGTGKTSSIKAIAEYTKRHLVEVSLGRIKSYRDLQRVFHDTTFCDKFIPHHKIIYILEDIDCLDDIVKKRESGKVMGPSLAPPPPPPPPRDLLESGDDDDKDKDKEKKAEADFKESKDYQLFLEHQKMNQKDPLTLSHILNIIDGILETPGRILIITTNHPERLDSALIRPGRVDMTIKFDKCTVQDTVDIVEMFYEKSFPPLERGSLFNKKFTPAEVFQVCFQSTSMQEAIKSLQKVPAINPLTMSAPISRKDQPPNNNVNLGAISLAALGSQPQPSPKKRKNKIRFEDD